MVALVWTIYTHLLRAHSTVKVTYSVNRKLSRMDLRVLAAWLVDLFGTRLANSLPRIGCTFFAYDLFSGNAFFSGLLFG